MLGWVCVCAYLSGTDCNWCVSCISHSHSHNGVTVSPVQRVAWHSLLRGRAHMHMHTLYTRPSPWSNCRLTGLFSPFLSLVFCHPEKHDSRKTQRLLPFSVSVLVFLSPSPSSILWHQSAALDHALAVGWETHVKMGMGEAGSVGALFLSGYWDLGLRHRERRKMIGEGRQEQLRPNQPHRQVLFMFVCLCVFFIFSCPFSLSSS